MLDYTLRVRDLVHGTILFTKEETALINHPFFQRLRQIRQNDVAFYVYPLVVEWTGARGFEKLHEALGAVIARKIVGDVKISGAISDSLLRLMTEKDFLPSDPLYIAKSVIDSPIDADRIDFTQRDGLLAGGEYGHYDTLRLCDSVFIEQDESGWLIAYSEKALTSMEALLLDRYRIYEWVHFHHRVIAVKMLVKFLIGKALELKIVTKEHFNPQNVEEFSLKDDVWLWNILRNIQTEDKYTKMVQRAVFYREKENILNLWKTRPYYHALEATVAEKSRQVLPLDFNRTIAYQSYLSSAGKMDMPALIFEIDFAPVGKKSISLYSEVKGELTNKNLLEVSKLVSRLEEIWEDEPQYFVLLVEENVKRKAKQLTEKWISATKDWILNPRLWYA